MIARRLLIAGGGATFTPPPPPPSSEFEIVAEPDGGGWTEVEGPHAAYADGMTYIGWVGGDSKPDDIEIAAWDGATLSAPTLLHDNLATTDGHPDSHNGPAVLVLPDGKILVAYIGHGQSSFKSRRSVNPGDISAFDSEVSKTIGDLNTYAQLSYIPSMDRVYNTFRQEAGGSSYQVRSHSDNHGTSWANGTRFYASGNANHYSAFACDGDWIHFAVTDDAPGPGGYGLWYFKMDPSSGDLYAADDTLLTASLPAAPSDLTELVDPSGGDCYPYSVSFTGDGRPVIAVQTKAADPVEFGEWRWSGSAWAYHTIGTSDPISPSILSVGGGLHVWTDSERFITSRMDGSDLVVSEYRSSDDGATWSHFADYGSGSSPVYVRDGVDIVALWFAPASSFVGSHDFDPGLNGVA